MRLLFRRFVIALFIVYFFPLNSFSADINVQSIFDVPFVQKNKKMKAAHISIEGRIVNGDYQIFKSLIEGLLSRNTVLYSVNLDSQGGDVIEAMKIGKLIRGCLVDTWAPTIMEPYPHIFCRAKDKICFGSFEFDTMEELLEFKNDNPQYSPIQTQPCCTCDSSCFLIWAGGVTRYIGMIRIHRPYFDKKYFSGLSPSEADIKYKEMSNIVRDYLLDMDIPTAVIDKMYQYSSDQIHLIDKDIQKSLMFVPFYQEWQKNLCKEFITDQEQQEWWELKQMKENKGKLSKTLESAYESLEHKRNQKYECLFNKQKAAQLEAINKN